MKIYKLFYFFTFLVSISYAQKNFSQKALQDTFTDLKGNKITFGKVLEKYKGKKILIDIWASWCPDCIRGLPKVKELQKKYGDKIISLFLSLDKSVEKWKAGIKKYQVIGEHYFVNSSWKGAFGTAIKLDWIPRYMVVDKKGHIQLFKAIKATDIQLAKALEN